MPVVHCPHCGTEISCDTDAPESELVCPECGTALRPSWGQETVIKGIGEEAQVAARDAYAHVKKGDVLSGFRIEEKLGAGAMAVVFKATQLSLGRPVALKILPKTFAEIPRFVEQFESETEVLASLNHPNIVSIIDRGRQGDTYFFAMEYVQGTTLAEMMRTGRLSQEFFFKVAKQTTDALRYAHGRGIIHRDIKPANIMLNDESNVKVADFGLAGLIARSQQDHAPKEGVMGTPDYMPPEQRVDASRADERSDIYSLGVVMYEALTGRLPAKDNPVPPSELNEEVDTALDSIVLRCMQQDPEKRYQSAAELLKVLETYHRQLTMVGEVCPECKSENPVTEKKCLNCGADLSELFDICPDCGTENRLDVEICRGCGARLNLLRERTWVRISKIQDHAGTLAKVQMYEQAIEELRQVLAVKGKVFEHARSKAQQLIEEYRRKHIELQKQTLRKGKRLAREGRLDEALELWKGISPDAVEGVDLNELIAKAQSTLESCRTRVAEASRLVGEGDLQKAARLLAQVEKRWKSCPGLSEVQRELEGARELEQIVKYQLSEADKYLQQGSYEEAREVLKFALESAPDHPEVKAKVAEIDARERQDRVAAAMRRAKQAYERQEYAEAARYWREAAGFLEEGDEQRQRLINTAEQMEKKLRPPSRGKALMAWVSARKHLLAAIVIAAILVCVVIALLF